MHILFSLIFFYNLYFKVIKIYGIYEIVLIESGFGVSFEFVYRVVKPDWFTKIEFITDLVQCVKDFVRTCVFCIITDDGIPEHPVIFKFFCP